MLVRHPTHIVSRKSGRIPVLGGAHEDGAEQKAPASLAGASEMCWWAIVNELGTQMRF